MFMPVSEALITGAVSVEHGDGWIKPWRLTFSKMPLFASPAEALAGRAECAAGVRLRFRTDSPVIGVRCLPADTQRIFDLTCDNELLATAVLAAGEQTVQFPPLPAALRTVELWLPVTAPVQLLGLSLADGSVCEPAAETRRRWITYGSSITHCGAAHSPSRTWPATAARARNLHLTSLGYGGNCHLEPMVALMIRDMQADVISLKLGINVQGGATLAERTFKAAAIGFIQIIREKHPDTPIAVVSPIISPPRESQLNAVNMNLQKMREELADCVCRIKQTTGDQNIVYVNGLDLFGADLVEAYLPDLLHPNGDGYELMGQNAAKHILDPMGFRGGTF